MTPRGLNAHSLSDIGTETAPNAVGTAQDQLAFMSAEVGESPAIALDFNTIKQSKQIFKTVGNGLKENGFKETGNALKSVGRVAGVVGHTGRAYNKFQKGQYLDAGKESARSIKDGATLLKKTLPGGINHGLNLVITVAVVDKYYDYLMQALEDPSHENLDVLVAHSKLVVQNVDDVYELGKFMLSFAQQKGPDFTSRLQNAFAANGTEVMQKTLSSAPGTGISLNQVTSQIIAGLDIGRAVLSGVEVIKDPLNDHKLGQAIKHSVVAGLSVVAAQKESSWVPSALALGTDLVPDSLYTYIAGEARDYYDQY
jgi:hypothetical protein